MLDSSFAEPEKFDAAFQKEFEAELGSKNFLSGHSLLFTIDWISTPMGQMISISDKTHLYLLEFTNRKNLRGQIARLVTYHKCRITSGQTDISRQIKSELDLYFKGGLKRFQTPLMMTGTNFQQAVWRKLIDIPYGQTWSYSDLAYAIGDVKTVRAVAGANARNALALIIPCHRVIGKDGGLGGYAGGVERKAALLKLEKDHG